MAASGPRWKVVGGGDKGGILVRAGCDTTSEQLPDRLSTGSTLQEQELVGDRLHYRKLSGRGPSTGWVSVKLKDKDLVIRMPDADKAEDATPSDGHTATPLAASPSAEMVDLQNVDAHLRDHFGGDSPQPPGSYQGGQLPVMPRTVGLPTFAAVPEKMRSSFKDRPVRKPMIRLYGFTGAADNYILWLGLATAAPEWCEVAVYEPRAHGFREKESWDSSLEQRADDAFQVMLPALLTHAKGGVSEGAPFGYVSHGIGSLLMVLVADRVRKRLALEPRVVFVNDGPPPDVRMLSHAGYELLCKDPPGFYQRFQRETFQQYQQFGGSAKGDAFLERWWRGLRLFEDHSIKLEGREPYFKFECEVHVLIAKKTLETNDLDLSVLEAKEREYLEGRRALTASPPDKLTNWDEEGFLQWERWVADKADFHVHRLDTDHGSIKTHPLMLRLLFRELAGFCGMSDEWTTEMKRLKWIDQKGRDLPI